MLKKIALPLAALALMSLMAAAPAAPKHRESFLPPNNLQHRIGAKDTGGITEAQYNELVAAFPNTIDYDLLSTLEEDDNTTGAREGACVGISCEA